MPELQKQIGGKAVNQGKCTCLTNVMYVADQLCWYILGTKERNRYCALRCID